MTPNKEFEKALHEALSSITPPDAETEDRCPDPAAIASHVRLINVDEEIGRHISSCPSCGEVASDVRRRQKIYERQKTEFTKAAESKYIATPVLKETFRPFAWMFHWKALVPELVAAAAVFAIAFTFHSRLTPSFGVDGQANNAALTIKQIESADPTKPSDTAVLLEKFSSQPEFEGQFDASHVAQARLIVSQKKAAVANDTNLADQWSDIEGKLQGYEFVAHYNSLRKQTEGTVAPGKVADVEGRNGIITVRFVGDPITDSQDPKLLSTSAVETQGLNQITILTPQKRWRLDSKNDFEVAAAAESHQNEKPQ